MTETAVMPDRVYSIGLAMLARLLPSDDDSAEAAFLRSHATCADSYSGAAGTLGQCMANPPACDRALVALAGHLGLNGIEFLCTGLAAAVETNLLCGRAIAHLQSPLGGSRPTLGLIAAAFGCAGESENVIPAILNGVAVASGLLQISGDGGPLVERTISIPVPICLALDGDAEAPSWPGAMYNPETVPDVPLPPSLVAEAERHADGLSRRTLRALALRCGSDAEARSVACEVARALGCGVLFLDAEKARASAVLAGLGPWLLLRRVIPAFCFELAPGERRSVPVIPHYSGHQLALCGVEGSIEAGGETVPDWIIGAVPKEERLGLWEIALGNRELARELANHRHGSGRIAQIARLAHYHSQLRGREEVCDEDIATASWSAEGAGLDALAQPLLDRIPDEALVVTPALSGELNRLLLRCRGREGLADGLGASASTRYRPGVKALFTGPSGTGKTLAAGWLATRLCLPLYRVDLAAVTSKYIGETEKNLATLLARAEHAEVILLFDEADSLFGKRTDIKDSNDRFANAHTNYLLQRIETFEGIVFLTSNSRARFDPAFFRRLDAIIDFPVPGPLERRSLWQAHLGAHHSLSTRELNQLAATADVMGGNIRNAVLTASVLARAEDRPVAYGDVLQALNDEYRKLGRQLPVELLKSA
jgi:hypothetical protein